MAVTAHFLIRDDDHQLSLISRLIAFKHVIVHHDGDFLARHFFPVLKEEDILDKVCPFSYALPTHCVVLSHAHIMNYCRLAPSQWIVRPQMTKNGWPRSSFQNRDNFSV